MRKYSLGVFLNVFTKDQENWKKQASFIQNLGAVEHVEVLLEDITITNDDIALLQKLLAPYNVIVHAPFMDLTLLSPHAEITNTTLMIFQKALKIAEKLNAKVFTIHLQSYPFFATQESIVSPLSTTLKKLATYSSIPLSIENLSKGSATGITFPSKPEDEDVLASILPKGAGLTIDTGHFLKDAYDVLKITAAHSSRILNFHLHDGDKNGAHYALGNGILPLKEFLQLLEKKEYSRFVTVEVVGEKKIYDSWNLLQGLVK